MDEIVVNTDCGGGYSVSISGPADSNLYLGGDSTSTNIINITSGTQANPSAIFTTGNNSYANTWGYSTATATTVTSSTFVGLTNESVQIFDKEIASEIGGDEYVVYYGASVSSLIPAGTYKMADDAAIVYYLTARSLEFEVVGNPTEWTN